MKGLKEARKAAHMTQQEVADTLGVSLATVRRWEQGVSDVRSDYLRACAELFNTSTDNILGSKFATVKSEKSPFVETPLFGDIAAGKPIEMLEIDQRAPVPYSVISKYPNSFLLRVQGESMNRILPNGCYALIEPCKTVDYDGKPYAVCVNGYNATIKRVRKLANGFELVPDSNDPTYRKRVFDYNEPDTETITIIGRVVFYVLPEDWEF